MLSSDEFSIEEASATPESEKSREEQQAAERKKERVELFLQLGGVGEAAADALADSGYGTIGDLIADSPEEVVTKTGLPIAVVKTVQIAADRYMQSQLSSDDTAK